MGIRMTGMMSGLDTDSIIKELMTAQSQKKVKIENKITKHEWKQEKWKELNTKIYALYTGSLDKLKKNATYMEKKVSSSDETKATATASTNATEGSHSIEVKQLASSQYVTSAKITAKDDDGKDIKVTGSTKLSTLGVGEEGTITISTKDKAVNFDLSSETTLDDFVNACTSAGLKASFDKDQGRLFVNSYESGLDNAFEITVEGSSDATIAKNDLREALGYSKTTSAERVKIDKLLNEYRAAIENGDDEARETAEEGLYERLSSYVAYDYKSQLLEAYKEGTLGDLDAAAEGKMTTAADEAEAKYREDNAGKEIKQEEIDKARGNAASKAATEYVNELKDAFVEGSTDPNNPYVDATLNFNQLLKEYALADSTPKGTVPKLENMGLSEVSYGTDGKAIYDESSGMSVIAASNSKIIYNGAELENTSNTITVNGLTFEVKNLTAAGEKITLTVGKNVDAAYDAIKDFVKEYNELLDELTEVYGAKPAKGYNPLTDEERESMTEEQIEKWETKIKDSLLRRDSTLGGVIDTMRNSLMGSVSYNGKSYSLTSFGITSKTYTEKGKLHIAGDPDDTLVADDKDKLRAALEEDPELVRTVMTELGQNLYDNLADKMKTSTLSSAFTVYNDKQMTKELDKYNADLKKMETKLKDLEDRYYKQFAAMEKALSNLNSQSGTLASMMGMSNNNNQ